MFFCLPDELLPRPPPEWRKGQCTWACIGVSELWQAPFRTCTATTTSAKCTVQLSNGPYRGYGSGTHLHFCSITIQVAPLEAFCGL